MERLRPWSRVRRAAILAGASLQDQPLVHARMDPENARRIAAFVRQLERVDGVHGDVVECGVGRGGTFAALAALLVAEGRDRGLVGVDSFEGFPEPTAADRSGRRPQRGQWALSTPHEIRRLLEWNGIPSGWIQARVQLIEGFFSAKTFAPLAGREIALLHLDVDLYDSYRVCLEQLYPLVVPGGVVVFDEYVDEAGSWPGAVKAIDEFATQQGLELRRDPLGKWFVVKEPPDEGSGAEIEMTG